MSKNMLGLLKCFDKQVSFDGRIIMAKNSKVQNCESADELDNRKKPEAAANAARVDKQKKRVRFEPEINLIHQEASGNAIINGCDADKSCRLKVKILMNKEEAARFLSKCKAGRVLEFKDVANELLKIPSHHLSVIAPSNPSDGLLPTISE